MMNRVKSFVTMGDRMTADPMTIGPGQTVGEALVIMFERNIRHLPVLEHGKLVGIVSDRDFRQFLGRASLSDKDRRKEDRGLRYSVREIMSAHPITIRSETPIKNGVEVMAERKIGALPVVDQDEKLIGIFTEWDALQHCLYLMDRYEGADR
jgi:acetoin utilization protein AcuB